MVITKTQQPFHTLVNLQIEGPLRAQFTSPQSKAALNPGSHDNTSSIAVNHCSIQMLHIMKLNFLLRHEGVSGLQQGLATKAQKRCFFFKVPFPFSRKEIKERFTLPLFWPAALQRMQETAAREMEQVWRSCTWSTQRPYSLSYFGSVHTTKQVFSLWWNIGQHIPLARFPKRHKTLIRSFH